jgi:hypothetical protein
MRFVSTLALLLATLELRCKNRQGGGNFRQAGIPEVRLVLGNAHQHQEVAPKSSKSVRSTKRWPLRSHEDRQRLAAGICPVN